MFHLDLRSLERKLAGIRFELRGSRDLHIPCNCTATILIFILLTISR